VAEELAEAVGIAAGVEVGAAVGVDVGVDVAVGAELGVGFTAAAARGTRSELGVGAGVELAVTVSEAGERVALKSEKLDPTAESIARIGAASRTAAARKTMGTPVLRRRVWTRGGGCGVNGSGIQRGPSSRLEDRFHGLCSSMALASLRDARTSVEGTKWPSTYDVPTPPTCGLPPRGLRRNRLVLPCFRLQAGTV